MYIAETLRFYRKINDYSQSYVAKKLNIDQSLVSKYENGEIIPPVETLIEFSKLYGVSMAELCGVDPKLHNLYLMYYGLSDIELKLLIEIDKAYISIIRKHNIKQG